MSDIINLGIWQILLAYIYVVIVIIIVKYRNINHDKLIVLASLRMTLQLILVGNILVYIIKNPNPIVTGIIIIIMESFAIYTIFSKFKNKLSKELKKIIAFSMVFGTLICLFYFLFIIVRIPLWYSPQYFIPIAGMLIGNAMTGITLGIKTMLEGIISNKHLIEEALILGATTNKASKDIVNSAFDAAIMPTINSMLGMGIVFLPGMMTGQILSGVSPITAISYQIAIMLGILGAVSLTIIIMLQLGYKTFFNEEYQLKI